MDAHQHRAQLLVGQHHPHRHIPPDLRQNLRMPRIHVARQIHCGLAERRRHHRPDLARHCILRRPVHRLEGCFTARRRNLAHRKIFGHFSTRDHLQKARIQPQVPRNGLHPPGTAINDKRAFQARFRGSGKGSQNDLRPNTCRIPHRDGNRLPNLPMGPFLAQRPIRFLGIHRSSHHQGTSRVALTASLARRVRGPGPVARHPPNLTGNHDSPIKHINYKVCVHLLMYMSSVSETCPFAESLWVFVITALSEQDVRSYWSSCVLLSSSSRMRSASCCWLQLASICRNAIDACSLMRWLSCQRMIFESATAWFWLMDYPVHRSA